MMKVGAWNPPNLALLSPDQLELAWKEWANVEVAKRYETPNLLTLRSVLNVTC
jgi:hypothetical protein